MLPRRHYVALEGDVTKVNAVRRSLITDLRTLAPRSVHIRKNTSYNTDEFLAQRIGLVPFVDEQADRSGLGDESERTGALHVRGRDAFARDICGDIQAVGDPCITCLRDNQEIDVVITFGSASSSEHAAFSKTAAVGMRPGPEHACTVSFESVHGGDGHALAREAIQAVRRRLTRVRSTIVAECAVDGA